MKKVDFLVIGSGVAGLSYALKLSDYYTEQQKDIQILVVTKDEPSESNTQYAQGGIAAVIDPADSYEKHIQDTLVAGAHLCDESVVRMVVEKGPKRIQELIDWGTDFDKDRNGRYDLAKEGGHSDYRILHHKDMTGREIQRALLEELKSRPNIEVQPDYFAVEILTQHHLGEKVTRRREDTTCYGAYILNKSTQEVETVLAKVTLIASGGLGQVYSTTTNPSVATGDGIAMVYRAKGEVKGMEFVQFHPTALYNPGEEPAFLITEALRGAGAILRNKRGVSFMEKYDERGSLAPRDIVARAIDAEMKKGGFDHVYLDATHIDEKEILNHFPSIYAKCMTLGIDIRKDYIPVCPAAHYLCGGIIVDKKAQTTINNLLAAGECTHTGLHGANRLASNSLLEAVVYANEAFKTAVELEKTADFEENIPIWDKEGTRQAEEMVLISQSRTEVRSIMSNYVGIVRSNERLKRAYTRLGLIYQETESLFKITEVSAPILELRNLINVAYLIVSAAQERKENIGLHYSLDCESSKVFS
ncbi:L-aspartate oxidase [Sediminitomix flava]|uniref:L-aspartate oxidase n=1 Tax=Sediminitomix flava TaxID=379075 RepID=A0A315ZCD6_SEDFL|nr:L-aspartate oxidase [Sediminitomix flava]PWJ42779.1 L-aspartate oxidase [Sediminitomix flava]